jgi:peptidoglycan hydrolase-like protein with peptidoglycan-binding domain
VQQQTSIRQSVLSARNVPRFSFNRVNFAVNIGAVVPRSVTVVSVATFPVLVDFFPDFRSDSFFVVDDEIFFLDEERRIVDVVPAGPRVHFASRGSRSSSSIAADLSPDEIREVQQVLIDEGFLTGEVDGVFNARTRQALISFQRRNGIQATGRIDTRTVASLGLSNRIGTQGGAQGNAQTGARGNAQGGMQGNQPSTTGQGRGGMQGNQPSTTGQGRGGMQGNQPSTTGQGQGGTQQPSARQNMNQSGQANAPAQQTPSTTGQGNAGQGQQPPVNQNVGGNTGQQNQPSAGQGSGQSPAQSQPNAGQRRNQ